MRRAASLWRLAARASAAGGRAPASSASASSAPPLSTLLLNQQQQHTLWSRSSSGSSSNGGGSSSTTQNNTGTPTATTPPPSASSPTAAAPSRPPPPRAPPPPPPTPLAPLDVPALLRAVAADDHGAHLTPEAVVRELDRHVVGQAEAKRAVATAFRARWRRRRVPDAELREAITPKNLLMVGSTGTGKTEIARRLARLADAPFVKTEASKFTEVGYHGRDVDQIGRDLAESAALVVKARLRRLAAPHLRAAVEGKLLRAAAGGAGGRLDRMVARMERREEAAAAEAAEEAGDQAEDAGEAEAPAAAAAEGPGPAAAAAAADAASAARVGAESGRRQQGASSSSSSSAASSPSSSASATDDAAGALRPHVVRQNPRAAAAAAAAPSKTESSSSGGGGGGGHAASEAAASAARASAAAASAAAAASRRRRALGKLRAKLRSGALDDTIVEVDIPPPPRDASAAGAGPPGGGRGSGGGGGGGGGLTIVPPSGGSPGGISFTPSGSGDVTINLASMLGGLFRGLGARGGGGGGGGRGGGGGGTGNNNLRRLAVKDARVLLEDAEAEALFPPELIAREALRAAAEEGIVFIDEIDKIVQPAGAFRHGSDPSSEGVQRDLLPLLEGSGTIQTRFGPLQTSHILFVAAGAFHHCSVSDMMPELQGRLPVRVQLKPLDADDFLRILTEPAYSAVAQQRLLLAAEGVSLRVTEGALRAIAVSAERANARLDDIGARRLHAVLERLLEEASFRAPELGAQGRAAAAAGSGGGGTDGAGGAGGADAADTGAGAGAGAEYVVDADMVQAAMAEVFREEDVAKYIL